MTDSNITKIVSIVMALIVVFAVVAPVVSAMSTTTTTQTVEKVYGDNSLAPYVAEYASTVRGELVHVWGSELGVLNTTGPEPVWFSQDEIESQLTDVRYYGDFNQALADSVGTVYINEDDVAYILYNGVWGQATCPALGATTVLTEFTNLDTGVGMGVYLSTAPLTGSSQYANVYTVYGVTDSNGVRINTQNNNCELYGPMNVDGDVFSYNNTWQTNTVHSTTVSSEYGTMSGTTFTADPAGDYLRIPMILLALGGTTSPTYYVDNYKSVYFNTAASNTVLTKVDYPANTSPQFMSIGQFTCESTAEANIYELVYSNGNMERTFYMNGYLGDLIIPKTAGTHTNQIDSVTVSDVRCNYGSYNGNATASEYGDYLWIYTDNLDTYDYYIVQGARYWASSSTADSVRANPYAPSTDGVDSNLGLIFTQDTELPAPATLYGYTLSANPGTGYYKGTVIPYVAKFNGFAPGTVLNYGIGESAEYYFDENPAGDYIKVPALSISEKTYYSSGELFGPGEDDDFIHSYDVWMIMEGEEQIPGINLTLTQLEDGRYLLSTTSDSGYVILPKEITYWDEERQEDTSYINPDDTASTTYTPVRGTISNGVFTESANGDYMRIQGPQLEHDTYYIIQGDTWYYGEEIINSAVSPDSTGFTGLQLTWGVEETLDGGDVVLHFTAQNCPDVAYMFIPYEMTYEATETVTTELIPMSGLLILGLILLSIVGVASLIMNRGGL